MEILGIPLFYLEVNYEENLERVQEMAVSCYTAALATFVLLKKGAMMSLGII